MGEIIKVESDEFIPADILILNSSDAKGICYVETKNLDGETNLKIKTVQKDFGELFPSTEHLLKLDGHVLCERPNNGIYKFEGCAKIPQRGEPIPLCVDNLLLRGSSLKNTEEVMGMCIFTGHDSKVM